MLQHGHVQESADELRFIAAIPDRPGDLAIDLFGWEFDAVWPYLDLASDEGASIYEVEGLVPDTPEWCAPGIGNAVPREGSCDPDDGIGE